METYTRQSAQAVAVQDDPAARELLRRAFDRTSRWRADFAGFTATLVVNDDGAEHRGTVTVTMPRAVEVKLPETSLQQWAQQQLAMMAGHRAYRSFDQADGKYVLTLGPAEAHPLGRLVFIHGDGMNSRYRVRDERICQIQRAMERVQFTINIEDTATTGDGNVLTTRFSVYYFSPSTGQLTQVESFMDDYVETQGIVLPRMRRVTFAEQGAARVRELRLSDHGLLNH
ncbi:MAG TPA: DUF3386 family protein [Candidatus Tectomicrobia bacterium]|jgi:hypothetical protein|nr:DUF3386 family protein [Candidatus Tectomicrobia bacterium]